jgi:hypothetical protein
MSNPNEFDITVTTTAPTPSQEHREYGTELMNDAMGFNGDIVEAKMTLMTKKTDGTTNFTTVDFQRERDQQLNVVSRTINQGIYDQLANSFDKMVYGNKTQIEGE